MLAGSALGALEMFLSERRKGPENGTLGWD